MWHELAAIRGLWSEHWVLGGDFNTFRYESERLNCIRMSGAMTVFSDTNQDLAIIDQLLQGPHTPGSKENITSRS